MVPRVLESSGNTWKRTEVCKVVRRVENRVTEFGFKYFCLNYVSKIGVSVTERNSNDRILGRWLRVPANGHTRPGWVLRAATGRVQCDTCDGVTTGMDPMALERGMQA